MNYPVWDVPGLGAGLVVAIIAIIHVFISHIAIGGGAFLFIAELWSDRDPAGERIRRFLHRYATFFLILTSVFGAATGVGIWFAIGLASPEGTSLLIHQFVYAWATEWVMFIAELSILFLYYYGWGHSSRRMQRFLAGSYFVISWMSLFIINGILSFMLTPGAWSLDNPSVAQGFFNPGFWPTLVLRTTIMFLLGGLLGILVASRLSDAREEDEALRTRIIRFSAAWVVPAALLLLPVMAWYWSTLPDSTVKLVLGGVVGLSGGKLEGMTRALWLASIGSSVVVIGVLVVALRPRAVTLGGAIALLLTVQLGLAGMEFFREMARKPYVISGLLYSNSVWKKDGEAAARATVPYLKRALWRPPLVGEEIARPHSPQASGQAAQMPSAGASGQTASLAALEPLSHAHGAWVFRLQCSSCHTRGGYRSMASRIGSWTPAFGFRFFEAMHEQGVMPPFLGTCEDRAALTAYLLSLRGDKLTPAQVLAAVSEEARPKAATAHPCAGVKFAAPASKDGETDAPAASASDQGENAGPAAPAGGEGAQEAPADPTASDTERRPQ